MPRSPRPLFAPPAAERPSIASNLLTRLPMLVASIGLAAIGTEVLLRVVHWPSTSRGTSSIGTPVLSLAANERRDALFGLVPTALEAPAVSAVAIQLLGTIAFSDAPDRGFAIVSAEGSPRLLAVGSSVGDATLREVYADHIVIDRGGRLEQILLPRRDQTPIRPRHFAPPPPTLPVQTIVERVEKATAPLEPVLKARPLLNDGHYSGLIVEPNGNPAAFRSLGLEPGDVILSVNRLQINENSLDTLMEQIRSGRPVKVWVNRPGDSPREVTLNTAVLGQ